MTSPQRNHSPNVFVADPSLISSWVIRDLYIRILTGDILDPHDAHELILNHLEDGDLVYPNASISDALDGSKSQAIEILIHALWGAAYDTAVVWDAERTDTDRFYDALLNLQDDAKIDFALFSTIFDYPVREGRRGVVALLAGAWHGFDHLATKPITLTVDTRDPNILISEIAFDVVDAMTYAGLDALVNQDFTVTINMTWRHHVLPFEEAAAAAELLPRD